MKKILSFFFILAVIFFVSCQSDDTSNEGLPDIPDTEEDLDVFIERLETETFNVIDAVDVLYNKYGSIDELVNHLDDILSIDGVAEADTTEYILSVRTNEGLNISWQRFSPVLLKEEAIDEDEFNNIMTRSVGEDENIHIFDDIKKNGKKICIVNQMSNDYNFSVDTDNYKEICGKLDDNGYKIDYINAEKLTLGWIRDSMEDNSFLLFNTHGNFSSGLHWFATGEKVVRGSFGEKIRNLIEGKNDKVSEEEKKSIYGKLGIMSLLEAHNENGPTTVPVEYIAVSESFFNGNYKDNILFFTACETLKGNKNVAEFFINNGAAAFFGYDAVNTEGPGAGCDVLQNMMQGLTVEEAGNALSGEQTHNKLDNVKPVNGGGKTIDINAQLTLVYRADGGKNLCIVHPIVTTVPTDDITGNKVTLFGKVEGINTFDNCKVTVVIDKNEDYVNKIDTSSLSYELLKTQDGTSDYDFKREFNGLESSTKYYYRAIVYWGGQFYYGGVEQFTTAEHNYGLCPDSSHPHAVDLGLSVKWACCNVGAESPEDIGDYYAWGEVETKGKYTWETYIHCKGKFDTLTKYCTSKWLGEVDSLTVLEPKDDVAHEEWGEDWRMPTKEEQEELWTKCTMEITHQNGVSGYKFTAPNGNSIFLPMESSGRFDVGAGYWSSSLHKSSSCDAYGDGFAGKIFDERYMGHLVRPVCVEK